MFVEIAASLRKREHPQTLDPLLVRQTVRVDLSEVVQDLPARLGDPRPRGNGRKPRRLRVAPVVVFVRVVPSHRVTRQKSGAVGVPVIHRAIKGRGS